MFLLPKPGNWKAGSEGQALTVQMISGISKSSWSTENERKIQKEEYE